MAKKKNQAASGSSKSLPFIIQLPVWLLIAVAMAIYWLFEKLLNLLRDKAPEDPPFDEAKHLPELSLLAEVLARGDPESLTIVQLAMQDRRAFIEKYRGTKKPRGGPALAALIDELGDELDAYAVLEEVLGSRGLIGMIDWRSEIELSRRPIERMLQRLGVPGFDWSFIDTLRARGDGSELRNNNFLTLVGDRLRPLGFTLAHLDQFGDSYGFAGVSLEDFERICGVANRRFAVRADFSPDDAYGNAKRILASHERSA